VGGSKRRVRGGASRRRRVKAQLGAVRACADGDEQAQVEHCLLQHRDQESAKSNIEARAAVDGWSVRTPRMKLTACKHGEECEGVLNLDDQTEMG
jgi:hypothetical protein